MAAAIELNQAGHEVEVHEASDGVGGRVRTDTVDGHLLDRGFQILLDAYPECQALLDYDALDLRSFSPGATIRHDGGFHRIGDPIREPTKLWSTLTAPIGSPIDKARILAFRLSVSRGSVEDLWDGVGTTALSRFESAGFSTTMIDRFLRPLFAGITLDPELKGSSQVVEFVFRMLSAGDAVVPARGMGQISEQLAGQLPEGTIRLGSPVRAVSGTTLELEATPITTADAVIVATDATTANELIGTPDPGWNGVTSVWFSAPTAPFDEPVLVLNGGAVRPINSMAVMSNVSTDYAPSGRATIVASSPFTDSELVPAMRDELRAWFGAVVDTWDELRVDRIERAQPVQLPGHDARAAARTDAGIWVAGDHRRDSSLNGAIGSGRAVARAVMTSRS